MRRNLINLIAACGILLLVMGCFFRSDRGRNLQDPQSQSGDAENTDGQRTSRTAAFKNPDNGDFLVEHLEVTTPRYVEIDKQVREAKLLEKAADQLNRALILPHDIVLRTKDCNDVNAFYDSNERSVTMCYELMEHFYRTFRNAGESEQVSYEKMFDAARFVFLHEIGHALIDTYKLPVMGNEEDAADRCAAYVNLTELGEDGARSVFAAADAFNIEARQGSSSKNLADEHLLQEQRFYNSLCMIYGSNPAKYGNMVSQGYLPKERAVRCPGEYQRTVESWTSLLEPWRKA